LKKSTGMDNSDFRESEMGKKYSKDTINAEEMIYASLPEALSRSVVPHHVKSDIGKCCE
jgi:hypothetical protein